MTLLHFQLFSQGHVDSLVDTECTVIIIERHSKIQLMRLLMVYEKTKGDENETKKQ